MKKLRIWFVIIIFLISCSPLYAQSIKIIKLKDGSTLKGQVVYLANGVYTIQTQNLGTIQINEQDILSISSPQAVLSQEQNNIFPNMQGTNSINPFSNEQMRSLQSQLMSDEDIMQGINEMMQDKELMSIISDPLLMQDIMSMDPQRIENNENLKKILENPQMKALLQMMQFKMQP